MAEKTTEICFEVESVEASVLDGYCRYAAQAAQQVIERASA